MIIRGHGHDARRAETLTLCKAIQIGKFSNAAVCISRTQLLVKSLIAFTDMRSVEAEWTVDAQFSIFPQHRCRMLEESFHQ
jgi:hypothetical protein